MDSETWDEDVCVGNNGERITIHNTWHYWAHLSIYKFALPLAIGKRVLDAGSGVGYGAAYLARHGASVLALDASSDAITYSRRRYAGDPVTYEVADLNAPLPLGGRIFDLVFSSNVFEHVGNVNLLCAECARVVKQDGAVLVAVPPITSAGSLAADIRNHFHVNHIPPSAWQAKLGRFFADVQFHRHFVRDGAPSDDPVNPAECVTIRETDFDFAPSQIDVVPNITAIFVCRQPRVVPEPETLAERAPADWREGEAAAQLIAGERAAAAELSSQLSALRSELAVELHRANQFEEMVQRLDADNVHQTQLNKSIRGSLTWKLASPFWRLETRSARKESRQKALRRC